MNLRNTLLIVLGAMYMSVVEATPYVVDVTVCKYMAEEAEQVGLLHQRGATLETQMSRIRLLAINDWRMRVSYPILKAIIRDYNSGLMEIPTSELQNEVYSMCTEQLNTTVDVVVDGVAVENTGYRDQ